MSEKNEHLSIENEETQNNVTGPQDAEKPAAEAKVEEPANATQTQKVSKKRLDEEPTSKLQAQQPDETQTHKLQPLPQIQFTPLIEAAPSWSAYGLAYRKQAPARSARPIKHTKRDAADAEKLFESCRQLCLSFFFRQHNPVRSLGFTSSIAGEGKSFLALATAQVLARDSIAPVTLVDCNWEHPTLHKHFGVPSTLGLAELLRGACSGDDVRYLVDDNLSLIPAGNGSHDAIRLLKQVQRHGVLRLCSQPNELLILDLPPIISSAYGSLAASLPDAVMVVVRAQAVTHSMVVETCAQLRDVPNHGIILNQRQSRIPRWLRQLL